MESVEGYLCFVVNAVCLFFFAFFLRDFEAQGRLDSIIFNLDSY